MTNRIPIQQFYDLLLNTYPTNSSLDDIYQINKKEIKYISKITLETIKDFSKELKTTPCFEQTIPIDLPTYNFLDQLKYIKKLIFRSDINTILYIIEKKIIEVKHLCHFHHNRFNDSGIYGFIELYLEQYLYFSLMLKDKNINIQIDKKANPQVGYGGEYYFYDVYRHDFNFKHDKIIKLNYKKLDYILDHYKYNKDIVNVNIKTIIDCGLFDINFIKEYTRYCLKMIYYAHHIMNKLYSETELDEKIYCLTKSILKSYIIT